MKFLKTDRHKNYLYSVRYRIVMSTLENRLASLLHRIEAAEHWLLKLEGKNTNGTQQNDSDTLGDSEQVAKVKNDLLRRNVFTCRFVRVVGDYYERPLDFRASLLSCHTSQLCKSIVFENTACDHENIDDRTNSRYYCIIVQYEARFDSDMLRDLIHSLRPVPERLAKRKLNFRLAKEEANARLSGFTHNAVSPFGLAAPLPVVLCRSITELKTPYVYLGGGEVDVKLGIPVPDLVRALDPIVGLISHPVVSHS